MTTFAKAGGMADAAGVRSDNERKRWGIVCIGVALFGGEQRRGRSVDEYGSLMAGRL